METTERFPQRLGNLAQNARFPHFHSRSLCHDKTTKTNTTNARRLHTAAGQLTFGWSTLKQVKQGGNSGGKGFEKEGSDPSENRHHSWATPIKKRSSEET